MVVVVLNLETAIKIPHKKKAISILKSGLKKYDE